MFIHTDWTSINDRLPETDGEYLVLIRHHNEYSREILRYSNDLCGSVDSDDFANCDINCGFYYYTDYDDRYMLRKDITHWMCLPIIFDGKEGMLNDNTKSRMLIENCN